MISLPERCLLLSTPYTFRTEHRSSLFCLFRIVSLQAVFYVVRTSPVFGSPLLLQCVCLLLSEVGIPGVPSQYPFVMCGLHFNLLLPAWEFSFAKTQLKTVLARSSYMLLSGGAGQPVPLHSVETPRLLARFHSQTSLLCVDREHRELRPSQRACNRPPHSVLAC